MIRSIRHASQAKRAMSDHAEEVPCTASWAWNMDTNEFVCSTGLQQLLGISFAKASSGIQQFIDKIHLQDRRIVSDVIRVFLERDEPLGIGYRIFRTDGQERFFSTMIEHLRNEDGHRVVITAIEDMGDHLSTERYGFSIDILRASEEKHRLVFCSIDEGFVIGELLYDKNGKPYDLFMLEANGRFNELLSVKDVTGKTARALFPVVEESWFERYHEVVSSGRAVRFQHFLSSSGKWFELYVSRVGDDGGRVLAIVFNDVTERKQREEFIGIVSHELQTPVTSIGLYAEVVKESLRERNDDINADLLHKLGIQVGRLNHLISNLLDVTRIEEGKLGYKMEYFDLNMLLREQIDEIQHIAGRRTISLSTGEVCNVLADKQRITQVVVNLLSNAIKYSAEGTSVLVVSEVRGLAAAVSVADNGIGIPLQSIPKIFDRFYRADSASMNGYAGLGLGLYISSEIIRNHGGDITVSSIVGEGSVFQFILPLERQPPDEL